MPGSKTYPSNRAFGKTKVQFFGHEVCKKGIALESRKAESSPPRITRKRYEFVWGQLVISNPISRTTQSLSRFERTSLKRRTRGFALKLISGSLTSISKG